MKVTFPALALCALALSPEAFGAVTDAFSCSATIYDGAGKEVAYFAQCPDVVRRPTPSAIANVQQTLAMYDFKVTVPEQRIELSFSLSYRHALKTNADGTQVGAEGVCASGNFVYHGAVVASACLEPTPDPFDPLGDWQRVAVKDGIPTFDPAWLHPERLSVKTADGEGRAVIDCQYFGTQR